LAIGAPLTSIEKEVMFIFVSFLLNTQGLSFANNFCSHLVLLHNLFPALHALGCVACGLSLFAPFPTCLLLRLASSIMSLAHRFSISSKVCLSESMAPKFPTIVEATLLLHVSFHT